MKYVVYTVCGVVAFNLLLGGLLILRKANHSEDRFNEDHRDPKWPGEY